VNDALQVVAGTAMAAVAIWLGPRIAARGKAQRLGINLVLWVGIAVAMVGLFDLSRPAKIKLGHYRTAASLTGRSLGQLLAILRIAYL
jgi:hypothetical protein